MCLHPRLIRSRSRIYKHTLSSYNQEVPCGHCVQCQTQAQDDWFLRIWQEIQTYNNAGGCVVFFTPTYRDSSIPYFDDVETIIDKDTGLIYDKYYHIPVFSKVHKDDFIKSVLKPFERSGMTSKTGLGVKFFWSSEFGMSEGFTHRPHYHVLLFLPPGYEKVLRNKTATKNFLQERWSHGMIRWSKEADGGIYVTREFAAKYCSKYVVKDNDFFTQPLLREYLFDEENKIIPEHYARIKNYIPKHWQSKSLGIGLVDLCKNDEVFKDGLPFKFIADLKGGKDKVYKVPRYIERKCLHVQKDLFVPHVDEYGEQSGMMVKKTFERLNERGIRVKSSVLSFEEKVEKCQNKNNQYYDLDYINRSIGFDIQRFNELYGKSYSSSEDILGQFNYYKGLFDTLTLTLYQLVLRGYIFSSRLLRDGWAHSSPEDLFDLARSIYYCRIYDQSLDGDYYEDGFTKNFPSEDLYILDKLPKFAAMDGFLELAHNLDEFYRIKCHEEYLRKKRDKQYMKILIA